MPSFSAPDYVHLRQQNSNSTLTSNVSDAAAHHGSNSTGLSPLQDGTLDDRVYLADDSVVVGDPIIVNFRDRKPWGVWPCHERLNLKKFLLCFLLAFLVGFLCVALILAMIHNDKKGANAQNSSSSTASTKVVCPSNADVQVCTNVSCVKAAASLLGAIDRAKDPCDNFFEFACGQWNKDHPIPDDMPAYGTFAYVRDLVKQQLRAVLEQSSKNQTISKPVKMAKVFYRSCMNTSYINKLKTKPILPIIRALGGWPLLNSTWTGDSVDVTDVLGQMRKLYGLELLVTLFVYADSKNTTTNILTIDQSSLGLGVSTRDYYLNDTMYGNQMNAYKKYIVDVISTFAVDIGVEVTNDTLNQVEEILAFERQLAAITTPEEQRRNHSIMYNKWTLNELNETISFIDWRRSFEILMPADVYELTRSEGFRLIVSEPNYLKNLDDLMKKTNKKILINYLMWRFVKSWSKVLDSRFDDIFQDFAQVMMGRQQKPVRWKICVPAAVTSFDMAAGALYVRDYFKQEDKQEAVLMIRYIQDAFTQLVNDLEWMDNDTKVIAIEKASAMLHHIGYPEFILNQSALIDYYLGLDLSNKMTYFEMNQVLTQWLQTKDLADLLKPFDRNKFDTSPAIVNAFYSPEKNAITFPAGILQPPFFKGDYPKSINYGAMGAVIGHEITHGFDDQGSQYDKNGNLHDWWSPTAFDGFRERTKCIIEQYGNYVVPDIKTKVNGKLTQGENIADNGGVKEAFKAYQKYISELGHEEPRLPGLEDLTNQQLFFLSYANFWCGHKKPAASLQQVLTDPHSPEMFRVIGVLSNLNEFSTAFNCRAGTVMNPDPVKSPKCRVW